MRIGHFKIKTQFNPERIRSSAAKTDAQSIAKRPCFLCLNNLPKEQSGLIFENKYLILANPFPIFSVHLTISHKEHIRQEIKIHKRVGLMLTTSLPRHLIRYN